nr:helix-turn-helix domain-containing protein [Nocardia alni]
MELNDLLKSIRVGYAVLAAALLDAATDLVTGESSAELRRVSMLLFEELDDFTGVAASAFLKEQSEWAAGVSAARLDLATRMIAAEQIDANQAEQVLGYPLRGPHIALIAWSGRHLKHDLRSIVDPVLRRWGTPTATLVIPVGIQAIWAWGSVIPNPRGDVPEFAADLGETCVVVGELSYGLEGFRRSHLEARAVERLVRLHSGHPATAVAHEDVALEVLLLADPDAAAQFVTRVLGRLASDDPRMADLRSTLRRYLDMDHSLAKVAAAEHISKNTVTYRVQKALTLCAHTGGSTTDLRAALRVHEWLYQNPFFER